MRDLIVFLCLYLLCIRYTIIYIVHIYNMHMVTNIVLGVALLAILGTVCPLQLADRMMSVCKEGG